MELVKTVLEKRQAAIDKIREEADYRNARAAVVLLAVQLGAFIVHNPEDEYYTFYDHERMVKTRSVTTVLLHLVELADTVAMEA